MRVLLQIILLLTIPLAVRAQQNTVVAGGDAKGKAGSFSYTVGQIDYLTLEGDMAVATAGMQQPIDDETYDYNKMCDDVQITITPNPTPDYLSVYINDDFAKYRYTLTDVVGKVYSEGELTDGYDKLDLIGLLNGVYLLRVYCKDDESVVFKIAKRR